MSWLRPDAPGSSPERGAGGALAVDRVACTGHGVCSHLLPGAVRLDDRGYPIIERPTVPRREADVAIGLCPARALYRRTPPPSAHGQRG